MIAMLDTSEDLRVCETELGCSVEQLLTPLTRFNLQYPENYFAIDNGAYSSFDPASFRSLLERELPRRSTCRFVALPDVVGSARRTLEVFEYWETELKPQHWPLALVAQDGQENLALPWDSIVAVFIGGTTHWKLSHHAAHVIKAAKAMEKWVHVGRVNTPGRFEYFENLGADSIDGTGLASFSWMRDEIYRSITEPRLFVAEAR